MLPEVQIVGLTKNFVSNRIGSFLDIDKLIEHDSWGEQNFLSELPGKWNLSLVSLFKDEIIGYLIASQKESSIHIHRLAIDKRFQSEGIGKYMVNRLLEKARLLSLPVTLKVNYENYFATSFYQKIGFKIVGKSNLNLEMKFYTS